MLLIFLEVSPADLKQLVERNVYHLVVGELLRVVVRANAEVAVRVRQYVRLQPAKIVVQRGNHRRIRLCNSAFSAGSFASANASGTSFSKKLTMPGNCSMAISV